MLAELRAVYHIRNSKLISQFLARCNEKCSCLKFSQQNLLKKPPEISCINLHHIEINTTALMNYDTYKVLKEYGHKNNGSSREPKEQSEAISNENRTCLNRKSRIVEGIIEDILNGKTVKKYKETKKFSMNEPNMKDYGGDRKDIKECEQRDRINQANVKDQRTNGKNIKKPNEAKSVTLNGAGVKTQSDKIEDIKEPNEDDIELPEDPTTCCMSGCANCVWIEYAEKLNELFSGESERTKRIILEKVQDPNMRAFLQMELDFFKKKDEDGTT